MSSDDMQIVPGLSISSTGQATVDSSIADVLFDLAIKLEEITKLPVDVQHVVAALVLSARHRELDSRVALTSDNPVLTTVLAAQLKTVFRVFGGQVGTDD